MNTTIKKVIETFWISFLGFYLPYLLLIILVFITNADVSYLIDFEGAVLLSILPPIIYGFFATVILVTTSFFDKRILNKWFVFGFGIYCFILGLFLQNHSSWVLVFSILISLSIACILMNIKKWIVKFKSQS